MIGALVLNTAVTTMAARGHQWKTDTICSHPPLVQSLAAMRFPKDAYRGASKRPDAIVSISVNEHGRATRVRIVESMGSSILDGVARNAVERSTFVPAASDCRAVPGTLTLSLRGGSDVIANPCSHPMLRVLRMLPAFPMVPLPRARVDVLIAVTVNALGAVLSARVVRSSAWKQVDGLERGMAADSAYLPAVRDCRPVTATQVFIFTFDR